MAILSSIGRRSWRVRLLIGVIYAGLLVGAASMVYPFVLMIAGSTKSAVDSPDAHFIPPFLVNRTELYRKSAEATFNESFEFLQNTYGTDAVSFRTLTEPEPGPPAFTAAWETFVAQAGLPPESYTLGEMHAPQSQGVQPRRLREFKRLMTGRYHDDLARFNREMEAEFLSWNNFYYQPADSLLRRSQAGTRPLDAAFREFRDAQPVAARLYFNVEGFYRHSFLKNRYGRDIAAYNAAHGTACRTWADVHLHRSLSEAGDSVGKSERGDWEIFVRGILNLTWIRAGDAGAPAWRAYLEAKYKTVDALNRRHGAAWADFAAVPLPDRAPDAGIPRSDWTAFLEGWQDPDTKVLHQLPLAAISLDTTEFRFRDHLRKTYGAVAAANRALGTAFGDWAEIQPPQRDLQYRAFLAETGRLRAEFAFRNFVSVFDYVVLHGRGIWNTVVYCVLSILTALIVNPIAAYALSRFRLKATYQILLFLMLTMAFPPTVTQIPAFLMLRELNLLNTFWALILPGLANGYSIFLLKGFFDSLPQELYESASLDGAGEFRIFWQITMNLSKPILAVIALGAFTSAYANFMMALLICQDEAMWTLMPWLYQLQQHSCEGVVFASLLIAAVPTFLVFVLCQNVIMRGIVVPVEK